MVPECTSARTSSMSSDGLRVPAEDSGDGDVSCTLYFGNLHGYVQQSSLEDLCGYFGAVESAKVIKDKLSGGSAGYGFVKFTNREAAEAALQTLNGTSYLDQELRVNWALPNNHKEDTSHHCHVFVGDLASDVTDAMLYNAFCKVGQCSDARVMWDHATGRSKGYGFVSFRRKEDAEAAITNMQGKQVGSRRVRVGWAQHKQDDSCMAPDVAVIDRADPANTNVYIGNIAPETSEPDLINHFSVYGPVAEVKLHKKGGYGFVKFEVHGSAVQAIVAQHGQQLHGRVLKCSWGKNKASSRRSSSSASSVFNLAAALQGTAHLSEPMQLPSMMAPSSQNVMATLAAAASGLEGFSGNPTDMLPPALSAPMYAPSQEASVDLAPSLQAIMAMSDVLAYSQPGLSQMSRMTLAAQLLLLQSSDAMGLQTAIGDLYPVPSYAPSYSMPVETAATFQPPGVYGSLYGSNPNLWRQFNTAM